MSGVARFLFVSFVLILLIAGNLTKAAEPVGWWKFDEASGTTVYDSSAGGNNGTVNGGATLNGSGILTLDGSNDYVSLSIGSLISSLNSCTIAVWINSSNVASAWQRIFDFGSSTTVNMFLTPRSSSGTMRFAITTSGSGGEKQLSAPDALPSGARLVVVRINADTDTGTLFLDGTAVALNNSMTLAPSNLGSTTRNWLGRSQYPDPYFNGSYDELRIYNYAMSDAEIVALSQKLTAVNPNPDNGSIASSNTNLSWLPGINAVSHDVYFGTNQTQVNNATRTSHPGVIYQNVDVNSFDPGVLNLNQTYYWRVDEVNGVEIWKGNTWSFTTDGNIDLSNDFFNLNFDVTDSGITMLKRTNDSFDTDFVLSPADYSRYGQSDPGWLLGDIISKYRINGGSWITARTQTSTDNRVVTVDDANQTVTYSYLTNSAVSDGIKNFQLSQVWSLDGNSLSLNMNIKNTSGGNLEFGDLVFPLPFNTHYDGADTDTIQKKRVLRHGFLSGHASHSYWTRVNGVPDFLIMTTPSPDTRFEYWDNIANGDIYFKAYVHSYITGPATAGTWRQQHTSRTIAPGQSINLKLDFAWAGSLNDVRDILYDDNDIDIQCVPGMTIPQDLYALIKLRTKQTIDSVTAQYPANTVIQYLGETQPDTHIYKVSFGRLGENIIRINHNGTEQTILEFFSTEPIETLIKKRASHMVNYEQVKDASKWYDGLFGEWDLRTGVLRTPGNTDGMDLPWWIYVICCDDPGNAHAPYLASKNVYFPVQAEISAIEYYIDNYVWGGLQYKDTEAYPYRILGVPTWYYNRTNDPTHYWRVFDYPHIVMLYYHMYQIAKYYPDMVSYLDKNGYLNRAYNTAMQYYQVSSGWGYTVGTYNELVFVDVINALREEGFNTQADAFEDNWDQKVKYFIFDKEYPYGSEYAMDSTAFESSHALVKWAMENGLQPDAQHPVIDPNKIEEFMHGQMKANLAVRGCIEPAFYTYGSDYRVWGQTRYTLSYMSQMGGWAVLDYGLHWTDDPLDYIRLGYGSYLSSWALMNSDPTGTNGYWYPSALNDGAIGWAFHPEKNGPIWLQNRYIERGIWYYNGEIDLGIGGALRTAKAVVTQDDVFGLFGFGCDVSFSSGKYLVEPKDGLRQQLVMHNLGLSLALNRDAFAKGQNVQIGTSKAWISFVLENERANAHTTKLSITGMPEGKYLVKVNGIVQNTFKKTGFSETVVELNISSAATSNISISLSADIDADGYVDFGDFALLAQQWKEEGCATCRGADLTGDGKVNEDDLEKFVNCLLIGLE